MDFFVRRVRKILMNGLSLVLVSRTRKNSAASIEASHFIVNILPLWLQEQGRLRDQNLVSICARNLSAVARRVRGSAPLSHQRKFQLEM